MKKKSTSKSAFFNLRVLLASGLCLGGVFVALLGMGAFSNLFAQTKGTKQPGTATRQDAPGTQKPEVVRMVGPAVVKNLRDLPYVPSTPEVEERRLTRYPFPLSGESPRSGSAAFPHLQSVLGKILRPVPNMPPPLLTFDGSNYLDSSCG